MPRLPELDEFLDEDLEIPIKSKNHPEGKVYVREAPDTDTVLRIKKDLRIGQEIAEGRRDPEDGDMEDEEEQEFIRLVLGPAYDEMREDGVKWPSINRALAAALAWIVSDADDATDVWTGKALAEAKEDRDLNRAERRAELRKNRASGSKKKASSGAASTGRKTTSTSGTKTRR